MGVFYYINSVALIEDLPLEHHYDTPKEFYAAADAAYKQVS
jgi:ribonuclease kappa